MDIAEILGYLGLGLNLFSMYAKHEYHLRFFAIIANFIYAVYGIFIFVLPIAIGCSVAVLLHSYRLKKLKFNHHVTDSESNTR